MKKEASSDESYLHESYVYGQWHCRSTTDVRYGVLNLVPASIGPLAANSDHLLSICKVRMAACRTTSDVYRSNQKGGNRYF